jgi:hypothetical protein
VCNFSNHWLFLYIAFAPGQVLGVARIHQIDFKTPFFKNVVERNPIHPGRLQGDGEVPVSIEEAIGNVAVLEAVFRSAETGRWERPQGSFKS